MYITSECIAWHAVSVTESVIIVSVNLLTIIVFMRNKNLRKRSTCLVINLTVVDMLVGVLFGVPQFPFLPCNICRLRGGNFVTSCSYVFTSRLRDKYCCDLFRADACDSSSNQASRHQKMGLRGNNSWCLGSGFYCKLGSFCGSLDGPGALATILLYVSFCYLCLLHLYLNQIFLWSASPVSWWSQ